MTEKFTLDMESMKSELFVGQWVSLWVAPFLPGHWHQSTVYPLIWFDSGTVSPIDLPESLRVKNCLNNEILCSIVKYMSFATSSIFSKVRLVERLLYLSNVHVCGYTTECEIDSIIRVVTRTMTTCCGYVIMNGYHAKMATN